MNRSHPGVAPIVHAWRMLTTPAGSGSTGAGKGAPTIVALSGGADSAALLIALASGAPVPSGEGRDGSRPAQGPLQSCGGVAVHVVHDLRARREALADRDACRRLCDGLGVRLIEREVGVHAAVAELKGTRRSLSGGARNIEAMARVLRYRALAEVAAEQGVSFIATAHQLEDQAETVLMNLLRGASLTGLAGIATMRVLPMSLRPAGAPPGVTPRLLRPLIAAGVDRAGCESICRAAGFAWVTDATNQQTTRFRNAVRHELLPVIRRLRPAGVPAIARAAESAREADRVVDRRVRVVLKASLIQPSKGSTGEIRLDRARLVREPAIVAGGVLRAAFRGLLERVGRGSSLDALTRRHLTPALRAIRDGATEPRLFEFAHGRIRLRVVARQVEITAT